MCPLFKNNNFRRKIRFNSKKSLGYFFRQKGGETDDGIACKHFYKFKLMQAKNTAADGMRCPSLFIEKKSGAFLNCIFAASSTTVDR